MVARESMPRWQREHCFESCQQLGRRPEEKEAELAVHRSNKFIDIVVESGMDSPIPRDPLALDFNGSYEPREHAQFHLASDYSLFLQFEAQVRNDFCPKRTIHGDGGDRFGLLSSFPCSSMRVVLPVLDWLTQMVWSCDLTTDARAKWVSPIIRGL